MKNFKSILCFLFIALLLFSIAYCKQTKKSSIKHQLTDNVIFLGDSNISTNDYFNSLVEGRTAFLLSSKNEEYLKYYSKEVDQKPLISKGNPSIRFTKEIIGNKNIKINLYTFIGNRPVDSIQFYRNIIGDEFGRYNCLSYYNPNTKNVWQIKFFISKSIKGEAAKIVSYTNRNITDEGRIKIDTIFYLDEHLDTILDKYNLYY